MKLLKGITITNVDVDRRSRGCGFITLGSKKAVADCLLFDGSTIKSSTVRIRNKR